MKDYQSKLFTCIITSVCCILFLGCSDEGQMDGPLLVPKIGVVPAQNAFSGNVGDQIDMLINIYTESGNGKLNSLKAIKKIGDEVVEETDLIKPDPKGHSTPFEIEYVYDFNEHDINSPVTIRFVMEAVEKTESGGSVSTQSFKEITIETLP